MASAWDAASDLSAQRHITFKERPFRTILSCAPKMYDELWTGGKGMYKLEPVVADGGELIIYGPHITEVCVAHGKTRSTGTRTIRKPSSSSKSNFGSVQPRPMRKLCRGLK